MTEIVENKEQEVKEQEVKEQKPEFSKEELLAIFDAILFEGFYEQEITLKGRLRVKFKSKSAKDITEISRILDSRTFNLITTMQEHRAFLSIVYGVTYYNNRDLSQMSIEQKTEFFGKIPSAVVASLSDAINKFDRKVDAACAEGEENF